MTPIEALKKILPLAQDGIIDGIENICEEALASYKGGEDGMIKQREIAQYERWPANSFDEAKSFHNMRMEFGLGFERGWKASQSIHPYKEEVDKELDEDVQRDNSSFYTYFRIEFEDWGEDFDFTICETLDEVREMLQLAEIHLDDPDKHTKVIVTGIPMTPPQYDKFKKGEELNFLESKEEAGEEKHTTKK